MNSETIADEIYYILDEWYGKNRKVIRPAQTSKIQIKTTSSIFVLTVEKVKDP